MQGQPIERLLTRAEATGSYNRSISFGLDLDWRPKEPSSVPVRYLVFLMHPDRSGPLSLTRELTRLSLWCRNHGATGVSYRYLTPRRSNHYGDPNTVKFGDYLNAQNVQHWIEAILDNPHFIIAGWGSCQHLLKPQIDELHTILFRAGRYLHRIGGPMADGSPRRYETHGKLSTPLEIQWIPSPTEVL